jgi:hypothetical protein
MTLGGCVALAVSVLAFVELGPEGSAPPPLRQSAATGFLPSAAPATSPGEGARLRLAQQYGTVCQTPQGSVCTVAPQPINSSCLCGGSYGLIVR